MKHMKRAMGLAGMAPGPNTGKAHPENKDHPCLLRGVATGRLSYCFDTGVRFTKMKIPTMLWPSKAECDP